MSLSWKPCPEFDSFVCRLDPRWKLAAGLPTIAVVAVLQHLAPAAASLTAALLLTWLSKIPLAWYLDRLTTTGLLLAMFLAPLPFLLQGPGQVWQLGPLTLSFYGLCVALLVAAKAASMMTLALILIATAPLDATLKAARSLHVPGLVIHLLLMTQRYVFLLMHEFSRIRVALRVRGYRSQATWHSYSTIGQVAGTLLVCSYEQAERVGQAMRCRGFRGTFPSLATFHTTPCDVLSAILVLCTAGAILLWDLLGRS